ncbi:hypothetical protein NBRC116590_37610 [Pelagimonas sp. KU-00592-HH]|uniref:MaoC family dehydratase n=1 Tax=Pelagimonas sp. KU-00592-HH TaxID=3127651 RepID=UPI00310ACDFA
MAEALTLSEIRINAKAVVALSSLLNDMLDGAQPVPLTSPALLLGHPGLQEVAAKMVPPQGQGVVHETQSFRVLRSLRPDDTLTLEVATTEVSSGRVFDFRWSVAGEPAGEMQTRLKFVPPEVMVNLKGAAFTERQKHPEMVWFETSAFAADAVRHYLELANDPNPIHVDDTEARLVGLDGAVVPGMFFAGVIEAALDRGLKAGSIESLKVRFMAPVPVGAKLKLAVLPRQRDENGIVRTARVFGVSAESIIAAVADAEFGR